MMLAQQLYEGLPIGKEESVGLITYMRTDSTNVAHSAMTETREFIGKNTVPIMYRRMPVCLPVQ